ncbi:hypothetical protein [Empedobacter sp. UBA7248]|uniref:hypothetical protein n=1 Tax=Empedobacter sp. UBA7248 TaxID=1946448 RepID=UPI0025BC6770|nr:hypothetical protein [Empedobacter sp. UBA7248]
MKFLLNVLIILIPNLLICQVGINVENPIATLDILNKDSNVISININNVLSKNLFKVDDASNTYINGALMPGGDSGVKGLFLTSKGKNTSPIWTEKLKSSTIQIFSAQRNDISSFNVDNGDSRILSFPIINSNILPEFGVWDQNLNRLTINKKGIYHITIGMDLDNYRRSTNNVPISNGQVGLFIDTSNDSYTGDYTVYNVSGTSKYNISCITTTSIILYPGNIIYSSANTGNPISRWNQGPSFISILYSELN